MDRLLPRQAPDPIVSRLRVTWIAFCLQVLGKELHEWPQCRALNQRRKLFSRLTLVADQWLRGRPAKPRHSRFIGAQRRTPSPAGLLQQLWIQG